MRLLNIPLSKAVRFHEHQTGKDHADALKDATSTIMALPGGSGLDGFQTTSSRRLMPFVSVKPDGEV
ncbi:hypothetical protein QT346_24460 [Escherichia coli]|nr:hypothetical protein [Escherichia coli]